MGILECNTFSSILVWYIFFWRKKAFALPEIDFHWYSLLSSCHLRITWEELEQFSTLRISGCIEAAYYRENSSLEISKSWMKLHVPTIAKWPKIDAYLLRNNISQNTTVSFVSVMLCQTILLLTSHNESECRYFAAVSGLLCTLLCSKHFTTTYVETDTFICY